MAIPSKLKGRYEIKQVLGQGGMGVVYRAYDTVIKRDVALKTIRDTPERSALQLFYKECDVLAAMSHPNVIEIFDIGEFEEDGVMKPYFVMPLLPGATLDVLIKTSSSRLTVERTVEIIWQVCRGLHAAHERGLVHRDLKPSNIFVMQDDSVKIIDFGLAHMVDTRSTRGQRGTLLYMAPEQIEMKTPSPLTDIFALGVTAYETFTGRVPWEGGSTSDLATAILQHIPPPVSELNPAVNQSVSRAVHKAMAKQPWHRFSTAREFGEILQKALRNEPIEMFDPARIQPRILRAAKAFEQADYQFAAEILSGLEAEGHIDPAMSRLRRQLDQAIRRKTIFQLLESARTRLEEQEYPLALQKIQEVLQLEPDNDDALNLKDTIESRRSQVQIDDWLRLARQHMSNYTFSHARQALQNVLQQRGKESRAMELLGEVDRREQAYLREVQEKEQLYQAAQDAYHKGEFSSALSRMQRVVDLDRRAPDVSAPERGAAYQNFYNQVRSEHDAIQSAYAEARKRLEDHNFARAREICDQSLAKYPGQALFQALQFEVEEQQRQVLSSYIAEADRRVEAEPDLDRRVNILKEAVERYPDETHFSRALRLASDKRDLVNSIVAKARQHESRSQFNEALSQWEILRSIHRQYPGLDFEIDRVTKRRDQQSRQDAKGAWVEQIDRQMELGDHARALSLLQSAAAEFPGDSELAELEKLIRQGVETRVEAQRLLTEGQSLCEQQRFDEGLEALRRAYLMDQRNLAIRGALLDTLMDRARALMDSDWRCADTLIQQVLGLDPDHSLAKSLRTLTEDRKREAFVDQCIAKARQLQAAGDLVAAVAQVEQGLATYPYVMRLTQLRATLEKALTEVQRAQLRRGEAEPRPAAAAVAPGSVAVPPPPAPAGIRRVESHPAVEFQPAASAGETLEMPTASAPPPPPPAPAAKVRETPEVEAASAAPPPPPPPVRPAPEAPPPVARPPVKPAPPPAPRPPLSATLRAWLAEGQRRLQQVKLPPALLEQLKKIPLRWVAAGSGSLLAIIVVILVIRALIPSKAAAPATVAVDIGTSPAGATILINKEVRGISKLRLLLAPGAYQLDATLEGYQPLASSLTVAPGSTRPVDLALQPLPATLRLYTDLEAGAVFLDDQPKGELQAGQLVLDNLPLGKHTLKVSSQQSEAVIAFEVPPGVMPVVSEPITTKDAAAVLMSNLGGRARLHSNSSSLKAGLDGRPVGEITPGGLALNDCTPGAHTLALGEGNSQREVLLEVGAAPTLTVHLFSTADRNVGTLVVLTGEDDVKVFVDGKEQRPATKRGQWRLPNLTPRAYAVRVVKEGYLEEAEQRIQVRKGEDARATFTLRAFPSLVLQGAPAGAQVVLDRNVLGTVAPDGAFSAKVTPGPHTIELRKDQYRPRRIQKDFAPGEAVRLTASDLAMDAVPGTLRLRVTPANAQITIKSAKEAPRPVTGTTLTLAEGSYTLTARAPNYTERSVNVDVTPGGTHNLELALTRQTPQASAKSGMADWENAAAWTSEDKWFVRTGGELQFFRVTPTSGVFTFTAVLRRGRRLQWILRYTDQANYLLFQADKKTFYRRQVVNGKNTELAKKPLGLEQSANLEVTLQIEVTPASIVHRVRKGNEWVELDAWQDPGGNFANGKFGLLINGRDQVALSDFSHQAK